MCHSRFGDTQSGTPLSQRMRGGNGAGAMCKGELEGEEGLNLDVKWEHFWY